MDTGGTGKALNLSVGNATTYVTPQMGRVLITQLPSKVTIGSIVSKIMLKAVGVSIYQQREKIPKRLPFVNITSIDTCDKSQLKKRHSKGL